MAASQYTYLLEPGKGTPVHLQVLEVDTETDETSFANRVLVVDTNSEGTVIALTDEDAHNLRQQGRLT